MTTTLLAPAAAPTTAVPPDDLPVEADHAAPAPETAEADRSALAPAAAPAVRRLVLRGALTQADRAELEPLLDQLVRGGARTVEVDLSQVRTIDPAVGRLLLRTSWRLGDPERRLLLLHPTGQVLRVLKFVGAGSLAVR